MNRIENELPDCFDQTVFYCIHTVTKFKMNKLFILIILIYNQMLVDGSSNEYEDLSDESNIQSQRFRRGMQIFKIEKK